MKKILLITFILMAIGNVVFSQVIYSSRGVTLQLIGELDGKALQLQTRKLSVMLDYETTLITIKFPINSLVTKVDSLNKIFAKSDLEIVYKGKLGLEYIQTEEHPPMKFTTEGWLTIDDSKTLIEGKGELHHIQNSEELACMLGLRMQLDLEKLGIELPIEGLEKEFEVVITQGLLKQNKS